MEEDSEQTSNEATLSYLDYLANLDSEQVREEVAKRSAATKEHTRKLLHYVEMSGPHSSTVANEKPKEEIQAEGEESKGMCGYSKYFVPEWLLHLFLDKNFSW